MHSQCEKFDKVINFQKYKKMHFFKWSSALITTVFFSGCAGMIPNDYELHRWSGYIDGTRIPKTTQDIEDDSKSCKEAVTFNKPGEVKYVDCMQFKGYRWK